MKKKPGTIKKRLSVKGRVAGRAKSAAKRKSDIFAAKKRPTAKGKGKRTTSPKKKK